MSLFWQIRKEKEKSRAKCNVYQMKSFPFNNFPIIITKGIESHLLSIYDKPSYVRGT